MKSFALKLTGTLVLTIILLLSTITSGRADGPLTATASRQPEIYFVPDVINQFNQLALRPDALAFGIDGHPDPNTGQHFQGIVRKHGLGTPYMFASRSGVDVPECVFCDDKPGNLYIVRMQSRDINGERMRSNRLIRDWPIAEFLPGGENGLQPNLWPTPPDPRDKTVARIDFNGQNGWPNYGHPGGLQLVGDVLIVPLEHPYTEGDLKNRILFIDVSDPENPGLKSQFDPFEVSDPSSEFSAGLVAVTPVLNPDGPGVRYIMLIAGKANKDVRLYRSRPTSAEGWTDLKHEDLKWDFIRSWNRDQVTDTGADTWPDDPAHQMFNFVRQGSMNGSLFMIAARNDSWVVTPGSGNDYLYLYKVNVDQYGNPSDSLLTQIERKNVGTTTIGGGGDASHFSGSTGVYVSPSGELIVYASEHDNDGPDSLLPGGERGDNTVRFGEYRHREMVRPGSPTLKPSVEVLGTFEVDEGSALTLAARGQGPITKAWLQLFEDDGMGLTLSEGIIDKNRWLAIDYEDWNKDDYDNFPKLLWFFNDNAGSWRWFAPAGCTIQVNQHSFNDSDFPGRRKTLVGAGTVVGAADLNAVKDDEDSGSMDDMISSMQFLCDAYYNATIGVAWDYNLDGVFETVGDRPNFSAAELDGPSLHPVSTRAQHPTDTTSLGHSAPATVNISIRNVPPTIASLDLVDSTGLKVGVDLPFAVANLEYAAEASFTDPGKPDHQAARLGFGDGTIVQSSAFDSFSDAFGGVIGRLRQAHSYSAPGTYTIQLEVKDDDDGVTNATKSITVVGPVEVVGWVVDEIDLLLATTTNQAVIRELRDARDKLAGNNDGSANGAIEKLQEGNLVAALIKIEAAIEELQQAEAAGAGDLNKLKYMLGLTGESVAKGAYQEAVAAVGTPNPGQAAQLEMILQAITAGHTHLVNRQYISAIDLFRDAVSRAAPLLP